MLARSSQPILWVALVVPAFTVLLLALAPAGVLGQTATVALAAQGPTADTVPVAMEPRLVRFALLHLGADSATYHIACGGLGVATCIGASADSVQLGPNQQTVIEVAYRATREGQGLVVLRARNPQSRARATSGHLITVLGS